MTPLVLASTSRYRRELLARLGVAFEACAPGVDETCPPGEAPAASARRLALAKGGAIAARRPEAVVLAGDQLADLGGGALGKPGDAAEARRQLRAMSGASVTYFTAIALFAPGAEPLTHVDRSRVALRRLAADEIERYLEHDRPFDCAGALRLEGLGIALCSAVETQDPTALLGLPLAATAALLRGVGYRVP